jgi:hypothetical protein
MTTVTPRYSLFVLLLALLTATALSTRAADAPPAKTPIHIIHLAEKDLVPDVVLDTKGILHLVYGNDHIAYYLRSADHGQTFSPPVQINSEGSVETEMGERGPKLAVTADASGASVIHVVWTDKWKPGIKTMVRYARSTDEGKTFSPRQTLSSMAGVDGVTVTAEGSHVLAFWHVIDGPKPDVKSATWLYLARSADGGKTFTPNEPLKIDNLSPLACSMCMLRARTQGGHVYLAFRSAVKSIRDFYLLQSPLGENAFTAVRINTDNWILPECPMCGPSLNFTPTGRALVAFMTEHKVYWSLSTPALDKFELHIPTPASEPDEIYPTAIANKAGQVLLLWQVGPMSTRDTATVKWATYTLEGQPTGEKATIGKSYSGTKPTAFVGADDAFYILTTAK